MPRGELKQADIARRLMETATGYAARRGYRIGEGAQFHMQETMAKAARRIVYRAGRMPGRQPDLAHGRSRDEVVEQLLEQSERQVHTLIDVMITSSRTIPGYVEARPGVIGERTFFAALGLICPLWPFC